MDFLALLDQHTVVAGDGAMGSRLIARGLPADTPGELWNLENPDAIRQAHRTYVDAGARYVLTNTFGANTVSLARHGLEDRIEEINRAAVENAREAAGDRAAVLGDLGPTGRLLKPIGTLSQADAREAFARQAAALVEAGVDAFIAETFDSSAELRLALEAARGAADLPLIASMKFTAEDSGRYRSVMGEGPDQLVETATEVGCAVVGTNCGQGIATMIGLVGKLSAATDLPILAQPNAGSPRLEGETTVYDEGADVFAEHLPALHQNGARIIGGCCGTTADHVRAIRAFADSLD